MSKQRGDGSLGSADRAGSEGTLPRPGSASWPKDLERARERLEEAGARLAPDRDLPSAGAELLSILVEGTGASRASLMVADPASGRLRIVAAVGLPSHVIGQVLKPARRRISDWVVRENRSLVLNGEVHDNRFESSAGGERIESALSVPLAGRMGPMGVINLARGAPASVFGEDELAAVERLARSAAQTLERLQELELAERARSELLAAAGVNWDEPVRTEVLQARHYQMAVARAVSRAVSGDLFERVHHAEGAQSVLVADVTAGGPLAWADAGLVRGLFVAFSESARLPARVAAALSHALHGRLGAGRPVTAWLAYLSPNGGLASCTAGFPAPLWVPAEGGSAKPLDTGGPAAGVLAEATYEQETIRMLPGDLIVAASDGVFRTSDAAGQEFGPDRVSELATERRRHAPDELAGTICRAALGFAGGLRPSDDLLVFVLRFVREP